MNLCGVILAGGRSSRMGSRKELLDWGGKPLIQHLAESIREAGLPCLLVANERDHLPMAALEQLNVHIIADQGGSHGPLSGIVAALRERPEEIVLVLSCDLPFIDTIQIRQIVAFQQELKSFDGLLAETNGRLHPLLALYHRRTLPLWENALTNGDYRLFHTLERLNTRAIPQGVLDDWAAFNVNTPEEYDQALAERERRG